MGADGNPPAERPSAGGKRSGSHGSAQPDPDPEVRMDKVAKIKEAVLSGKYKVPAAKVAAKIIDDMRRK